MLVVLGLAIDLHTTLSVVLSFDSGGAMVCAVHMGTGPAMILIGPASVGRDL